MVRTIRDPVTQDYTSAEKITAKMTVEVTKYRGRFVNGKREADVHVVEKLNDLHAVIATFPPIKIGKGTGKINLPTFFLHDGLQVIASEDFKANHIDGTSGSSYFGDKLIALASPKVNFYMPTNLELWQVGESKILGSNSYVKLKVLGRSSAAETNWLLESEMERQIQVTAKKVKIEGTEQDAVRPTSLRRWR